MVDARAIQELLLGAGGFLGTGMAGVGVYRLCSAGVDQVRRIPITLERSADALERGAKAIEAQSAVLTQVLELKGMVIGIGEEIRKTRSERDEIGRELRIMARKMEGVRLQEAG